MNKKLLVGAAAALLVLIVVIRAGQKPVVGPEQRIRNALQTAVDAAEKQDLKGTMAIVSERFKSAEGDRQTLNAFLFMQLRRGDWRKIFLANTEVKLAAGAEPHQANVTFDAVLSSGSNVKTLADVVPDQAGVHRFSLVMEREGDDWRVTRAEHQERSLADVLGLK